MKKYLIRIMLIFFLLITVSTSAQEIKDGLGEASLPDSSVYRGEFKKGKFNGRGVLVSRNQSRYEGEFKDGLMHGKGVYVYTNADKYEGDFKDGLMSGKGTMISRNGIIYKGEFKDGFFNGKGVYSYATADKYEGDFKDGFMSGKGTLSYRNGTIYKGDFKDGFLNGKGTITTKEFKYEGDVKDNAPHGKGNIIYATGDKYEGEFKNGVLDGQGSIIYKAGHKYEGQFRQGYFNGKGIFLNASGDKYEGDFLNNYYYGRGVLIQADGKKQEGVFLNNNFIGELDLDKEFTVKIKTARFDIYYNDKKEADFANRTSLFCEDFLNFISKDFGANIQSEYPISILILPDEAAYNKFLSEKMKSPIPGSFGCYFENLNWIIIHAQNSWGGVAHEIIHPIITRNYPYMPAWGKEGIAAFFERFYGYVDDNGRLKIIWGFHSPGRIKAMENSILDLDLEKVAEEVQYGNESDQSEVRLISVFYMNIINYPVFYS